MPDPGLTLNTSCYINEYRTVSLLFILRVVVAITLLGGTCVDHAMGQSATAAPPALLVYGTLDDALPVPGNGTLDDGVRLGVVATAYPSGWGVGYAHQRLTIEAVEPSPDEPTDVVHYRSIYLVREIHLRTPFIRPCVELGASLVKYEHNASVSAPGLYTNGGSSGPSSVEHVGGVDLRVLVLFPLSSRFGLEVALHSNINALHSYSSIDIGFALGCVRPKLASLKATRL
ncbi:MAG TPA: hypothetical protein VKG92_04455 [Flavobacteriales bacterium]|nr:hypothetical protein [Flavobacteriales bacterium]